MNKKELTRKINSVRKAAFIIYFSAFKSYADGTTSKDKCINFLVSNSVSNDNGAAIRCGNSKQIFQAKMERNTLEIISKSNRLTGSITDEARNMIVKIS